MKKLLLLFVLFLFSASATAELKTTYTADGHRKLEWVDGYVRPEIEYARKTAPNGTMSDEEYLKAHKAELRALLEKSQGTEAHAARFPKELDKYNH